MTANSEPMTLNANVHVEDNTAIESEQYPERYDGDFYVRIGELGGGRVALHLTQLSAMRLRSAILQGARDALSIRRAAERS